MFWGVWTVLQIGADSNRLVQLSLQHMAYLSGTFSPQPQRPLKYLVSPLVLLYTHTLTLMISPSPTKEMTEKRRKEELKR